MMRQPQSDGKVGSRSQASKATLPLLSGGSFPQGSTKGAGTRRARRRAAEVVTNWKMLLAWAVAVLVQLGPLTLLVYSVGGDDPLCDVSLPPNWIVYRGGAEVMNSGPCSSPLYDVCRPYTLIADDLTCGQNVEAGDLVVLLSGSGINPDSNNSNMIYTIVHLELEAGTGFDYALLDHDPGDSGGDFNVSYLIYKDQDPSDFPSPEQIADRNWDGLPPCDDPGDDQVPAAYSCD